MKINVNFNDKPNYTPEYLALQKKFNVPLHGLTPEQIRFHHYAFRNEINVFFRMIFAIGDCKDYPPLKLVDNLSYDFNCTKYL